MIFPEDDDPLMISKVDRIINVVAAVIIGVALALLIWFGI